MEGKKRVAAACCLIIIVLLPDLEMQAAAHTPKFCRCYKDCYNKCRSDGESKSTCGFVCFTNCPVTATKSAGDCAGICQQLSICGMDATEAGSSDDVKACMDGCTKNLRAHASTTANLNY